MALIKENKRSLSLLFVLSLLAFSSGYMIAIEGRKTENSVTSLAESKSYSKGYEKGQSVAYQKGYNKAKKEEQLQSYREWYQTSYLQQFEKAGIKAPKEIDLP